MSLLDPPKPSPARISAPAAMATPAATGSHLTLLASTVGAGLTAGLFYGFQVAVVRGLTKVDDVAYVTTFQAINRRILNPWFMTVFVGTPLLTAAAWWLNRKAPKPVVAAVSAALSANVAMLAITAAGNVPLNDKLDTYRTITPAVAAVARDHFETSWNRLNLARTAASVAGFASLVTASLLHRGSGRRVVRRRSP